MAEAWQLERGDRDSLTLGYKFANLASVGTFCREMFSRGFPKMALLSLMCHQVCVHVCACVCVSVSVMRPQ